MSLAAIEIVIKGPSTWEPHEEDAASQAIDRLDAEPLIEKFVQELRDRMAKEPALKFCTINWQW